MNKPTTLIDILHSQAKAIPGNLALKSRASELSYKQLVEQSNKLANYLVTNGVVPGTLVPVCLHTPLDMVIGIWGILKSGGAYVPIDPEFPTDRIEFMIRDTSAKVVISDSFCGKFLEAAKGSTIVLADNGWAAIKDFPEGPAGIKVSENGLLFEFDELLAD